MNANLKISVASALKGWWGTPGQKDNGNRFIRYYVMVEILTHVDIAQHFSLKIIQ
jgi:hypothetical protein